MRLTRGRESRPNRILFLTHYYPPETNAPASRVSELARLWASSGHVVDIVTGMPNHPNGIIPESYRGAWYRQETQDGVTIHRGRIYPAPNRGHLRRILNYLSFLIAGTVTALAKAQRPDCVIATSPQLFCAVSGWIVAALRRIPFILEIRDIWPEEIVAVGAIRNRLVIRLLERLEMFLYRRATRIVVVAQGSIDILTSRGVPQSKLELIPNGVDTDRFLPGPRQNRVRRELQVNGDFLVSYIGTIGMAHRLEVILDAAEKLRDHPGVKFMIVGDGAERDRLRNLALRRGLTNVLWEDAQPRNRVADYYSASDACLVHMRRAELFTHNVPSKMYEIMAAGRPMLLGTFGESRELGESAGCAVAFTPENADELVDAIAILMASPDRGAQMGQSGRQYVQSRYDRRLLARRYMNLISGVVGNHRKQQVTG
ncbi:MAG: glycosyltransferase family 4 protein [Candidatus Zixiibacteriota bacterium]